MSDEEIKPPEFFRRDTSQVAKDLVGCFLVMRVSNKRKRLKITETEGYLGPEDEASHARFEKTQRSEIMWGSPGTLYIYLIYGMHNMLNIVTGPEEKPGAVLIRSVEGFDGPGKLTKASGITKEKYNGKRLGEESGICIRNRSDDFTSANIKELPRVGIDYASDEWRQIKLRFKLLET